MTKAGAADLQWTSVPRWAAPVLPPAVSCIACWLSDAARPGVAALLAAADPAVPVTAAAWASAQAAAPAPRPSFGRLHRRLPS